MEWSFMHLFTILFVIILILIKSRRFNENRRPPGPRAWPIFGNIFDLGALPHQTFHKLRSKYGAVIWLRLGFTNTLVIQSAKAAEHLFKNHDVQFSDRKVYDAFTAHNYNEGSLSMCHYGSNWRILRRLVTLGLMTSKKIIDSVNVRRNCIDKMIRFIEEDAAVARSRGESGEIVVSRYVFVMTFNLMGNLIFSKDLVDSHSEEGCEFFEAMDMVMKWGAKPNLVDFFPSLRGFDPQRIRKNMEFDLGRTLKIVEKFVMERIEDRKSVKERGEGDFLDTILENENGKEGADKISTHNMIIIILEMFFGGTETTSGTSEWVMVELFRSPESMKKVKEELNRVVGTKRKVEENDLDELPYLQAVIKETMRLHPVLPLLVPRNTLEETKFMGYVIPKGTQVFVNTWGIGRDPDTWEDPLSFKPERFLGSNIDYRGQNFELLPFGSGRRICVGYPLAHRILHLTVATLLHCFEWEIDTNSAAEVMDMNEKYGFTVKKLIPFRAIPKKKIIAESG
ncbi:iridoid oxidase-like [Euphorbia lathyris]|uniref:iridoid oxidase-like n=1 Tax=Euphorbia lathyris TaxID=212925 RepID=UPI003313A24C